MSIFRLSIMKLSWYWLQSNTFFIYVKSFTDIALHWYSNFYVQNIGGPMRWRDISIFNKLLMSFALLVVISTACLAYNY